MSIKHKISPGFLARACRAFRWSAWTFEIEVTEDDIAADLAFRDGVVV
jgi:hypothetical protein